MLICVLQDLFGRHEDENIFHNIE